MNRVKPIVLIVRDGWGHNPYPEWDHANAVHLARTPVDDRLMREYPNVLVKTSGFDVGLPDGVMGNSEVGHQNIGAGRIVEQEVMRITGRIHDGSFFENRELVGAFDRATQTGGSVHLMGLCSDGRVHSDLDHLFGLLELSKKRGFPGERVFIHAFMDGRDTPPQAGVGYVDLIERKCREVGVNPVASVVGRYYAMDRDNRWDRVEKAYRMLTRGEGASFPSATAALQHYYEHPSEPSRSGDEFVTPCVIPVRDGKPASIGDGDSIIFFNFRGDRPREITKAFTYDGFPFAAPGDEDGVKLGFDRGAKLDVHFVAMTAYEQGLPVQVAFQKPDRMGHLLGEYVSELGLTQFRCAETEKYPHVTFFFNDYQDQPSAREDWHMVPSPRDVTTYDQKPQMSALEVTEVVLGRIAEKRDDLIVVNYANGDMVGHTGDLAAAIQAVETVDVCVGRVVDAALELGGGLIVTADHGNAEQMVNPETGGPHTAHTTYDVPLVVADKRFEGRTLRSGGRLADLAPTLLDMMGLDVPDAMSGESLLSVA